MQLPKKQLAQMALKARDYAYVPYSNYQVGAALLCEDGTIYTGCNIENAAYSVCNCAERTALFKAVSEGKRSFVAIAVAGGKKGEALPLKEYAYPCGVCRQALYEFTGGELPVLMVKDEDQVEEFTLSQLLSHGFGGGHLA